MGSSYHTTCLLQSNQGRLLRICAKVVHVSVVHVCGHRRKGATFELGLSECCYQGEITVNLVLLFVVRELLRHAGNDVRHSCVMTARHFSHQKLDASDMLGHIGNLRTSLRYALGDFKGTSCTASSSFSAKHHAVFIRFVRSCCRRRASGILFAEKGHHTHSSHLQRRNLEWSSRTEGVGCERLGWVESRRMFRFHSMKAKRVRGMQLERHLELVFVNR